MSNNILLTVYTYVDGVSDTPFPNAENPLKIKYTYNAQRMGGSSLTATAMYPTCLDDLWVSGKQYVDFKGERYFIVKTPSSSKSNDDVRYKHELEFLSGRSVLDNVYVYDVVTGDAGNADRYVSNSTKVLFYGDIQEFVARLNFSLEYSNLAYRIVIDEGITSEAKQVSLENMFFSNALQEIFNIFELPFYFVGTTIHVGFTNNAITHTFKYGKDFELLSVSKTNANYKITNRVTGTGSSDNIQFYYPNPSNDRKAIEEAGGTWITPSQVLMPPIYRQTNGAERFYNALNNKYINPDTGDYYTFENLYLPTNPKEQIVDFSYIKPSIKNALNKAGVRMDVIKAIAFDQNDDDSINKDTGEYVHSYFYVKLNKFDGDFGFNLFDQALVGSDATVSMTSGASGACNFQIGVTEITQEGKQVFRNPVQVDSKGDIVPGDYAQKVNVNNLQPQQQNTMTNEVWIALKKDNTTFGIVMPNAGNNIKPSVGDSFVFLNIDMPQAYITKAEKELEEAIIKYMANNNREKFTFSIKLSRIFLAENPSIGNLLNENARINLEYNGQFHQLYVSNYTLKVDENVLPEISIQLMDTLTIGKNSLQTAIDGVKQDIMNSIGSVDFLKQGLKYFLRKDTSDYARDFITFLRGLKVGSYTEGGNSGGIFAIDANGKTYIETDMLKVRAKAYFETLEIINTNSIGGRQIITPGGSITCNKVVEGDTYYRCYFVNDADNTPIENRFKVDDQALSQDFNIKEGIYENVSNHYYWRKVVAIGEDYIDLSKTDADVSSHVPKAGDVICQLGNKTDKTRQNAIIFSAVDFYSPSITLYAGIDNYSYVNKEYVSYGVDKTTNEAFFNVYGRMYVGDRNKTSYMQYSEKDGLQIKGKLQIGTTIGSGQTVEDALEQTKNDAIAGAKENLDEFATIVNGSLGDLQNQIDGAIETWFYDPVPTLTNQPAVNWTTDKDKNIHLGDLYYDGNGKAYRFQLTGTTYKWKVLTDSDITKALADAKKAQDTADSKRKIFVRQPLDTETYEFGDLWVNATFGSTYSNDVLRCKTAKAAGTSFSINHWEKASKYTDDQAALEAQRLAKAAQADVDQAKRDINGLDGEVDGLRNFTDQAFKDGVIDRSEATAIAKYLNNIETSQKDVSQSFAKVYNNPLLSGIAKTNLNNANIAFNAAATDLISTIRTAIADGITTNTEKAAVDDKYSVFNTKYGDYIAYLNEANKFIQDQIKTTADNALQKAVDLNYLKQAFKEETTITDGVVQTSILALGYTDGGSYKIMSGSNGIYNSSKTGGGIASWWGGSMKDRNDYTSQNMPADVAKGLVRFDGTGYFANGNLWWDNNGKLHADPLSFFVGPENVGDLLSIFQIVKSGTSINYVVPRYPFQKLSISSYLELGSGYRIKVDEANNAIYVEKDGGGIVNFYATGGITALGVGTKSPQTILDALPIDTNTLSKEGGKLTVIGGGSGGNTGSISLNGQRYDSVDGVITLPNLKPAEPTAFSLKNGNVSVRTPGRTGYYEFWDSGSEWAQLVAKGFVVPSGTSSQFLKADGSIDGNLYALAHLGNQQMVRNSAWATFVVVQDKRDDTILPASYEPYSVTTFFKAGGNIPDSNWWSGFHVRGLGDGYCTWELVGPSSHNNVGYNLRYRTGIGDTWSAWKMIMTDVEADGRYVLKTGDTMTGTLTISADAINPPSLSANPKLQFTAANGSQPVALVYTDFDAYRAPAGIKLLGNQGGEWFESPRIISDKYNANVISSWTSDGSSFIGNYFGNGVIMNNGSSSVTGTIKIQLPVSWTNTMGVYKIMLYEYTNRGSSEITVSFYNYSSSESYYNYSYQVNGGFEGAVRLAHDGSKCCILLGNTSYTWNYPKVYVHQIFGGQNISSDYLDATFNISIITSESSLSKITSIPKTSMNKHDTNYIRALNKNGYYGMGLVGDTDNDWIRTTSTGLIPYKAGTSQDNSMLGSETWQFGKIYGVRIFGQRVASITHNLYLGSSGNSGWVYCQDLCSANGAAEAYWSIRTNGAATFTNLTSKNKITGDINGNADGYATYLPIRYYGGVQANPQTYFNQDMGLRVAMTGIGWGGPWGDTLWINGYSGNDVKSMCALHFIRNGTPRFGISTQNSDGTSYGTNYEVWTAYNSNKDGVNWSAQTFFSSIGLKSRNICIETNNSGVDGGCSSEINNWNSNLYLQHKSNKNVVACNGGGAFLIGSIDSTYKLNVQGSIRATSWIRTDGATGWYSQSYGGGIHMTDSTWVRVYSDKQFYVSSTSPDAIHTAGGINASGRIYAGGIMENNGGLNCHGIVNSSGASGFNVYAAFHGRSDHGSIEIGASDNVFGIGVHSNGHMYWWWTNSGSIGSLTGKSYIMDYGGGNWSFTGNIVATGGITAKTTSDMRLKNRVGQIDYAKKLLSLGLVFDYIYNDTAKSRIGKMVDDKRHIGLSYQAVSKVLPAICGKDDDGYGYINYISPDFISLIAGATQLNTLGIKELYKKTNSIEDEIKKLKKENECLKKEINKLKREYR